MKGMVDRMKAQIEEKDAKQKVSLRLGGVEICQLSFADFFVAMSNM